MPNYCHNTLIVEGSNKLLSKFKNDLEKKQNFSLEDLFPMPEILERTIAPSINAIGQEYSNKFEVDLAEEDGTKIPELKKCTNNTEEKQKALIEKYGCSDWHDWRNANWGTKWIQDFELVESLNEKLIYTFESAWAPPISLLENISSNYSKLKFSISYNVFEEMGDETKLIVIKEGKMS